MSFPLCSNDRVKDALLRLISIRRLPHAMIIEGNAGTGKRTLSAYIAKAALCESDKSPCCCCRSCHLADAGTHPDIERIAPEEKKKNISVAQIDRLREIAYFTPHTAFGKVLIIEQADTMNTASQNKLLKVLEEPPENVFFILLTESANSLLNTVVSRCTVFSLYEPEFDEALKVLLDRGADRKSASKLLSLNKNNIGKSLEGLGSSKLSLGIEVARDYIDAIDNKDRLSALKAGMRLEKNRAEVDIFVKELKYILIEKVKASGGLRATRLEYTKLYDTLCEVEPLLITNINISLFFTALTSRLMILKEE